MKLPLTFLVLLVAAFLETGGDALVRSGLRATTGIGRTFFFLMGALVLFSYGYVVNSPPWDFGRLLGVYIVFFFIAAQLISYVAFGVVPGKAVLVGGVLIVSGGLIISLASSN